MDSKFSSEFLYFFKGLCKTANLLKPYLWINKINPYTTNFLLHPWFFEIPIMVKPVYFKMDLDFENMQLADCIINFGWNLHMLNIIFGPNWNSPIISHGKITPDEIHHWVWFPKINNNKILALVYNFLYNTHTDNQHWNGWRNIWKLKVALRVKTFIWLMLQGNIKTYDFLYQMNLSPLEFCVLYRLITETVDHLFRSCTRSQIM